MTAKILLGNYIHTSGNIAVNPFSIFVKSLLNRLSGSIEISGSRNQIRLKNQRIVRSLSPVPRFYNEKSC